MRERRNAQDCAVKQGLVTRTRSWQTAKWCIRVKHAEMMNSHASWSTTGQKSSLAILFACGLNSQLSQVTRPSCQPTLFWKNLALRIPFSLQYKYPLHSQNVESFQREFCERNPREKQDWLVQFLRGTLPKHFLTIPISVRRLFGALGSN